MFDDSYSRVIRAATIVTAVALLAGCSDDDGGEDIASSSTAATEVVTTAPATVTVDIDEICGLLAESTTESQDAVTALARDHATEAGNLDELNAAIDVTCPEYRAGWNLATFTLEVEP